MQNPRLVFVENAGDIYGMQYIYLCEYVGGEPALNPESDEYAIKCHGPKPIPAALAAAGRAAKHGVSVGIA